MYSQDLDMGSWPLPTLTLLGPATLPSTLTGRVCALRPVLGATFTPTPARPIPPRFLLSNPPRFFLICVRCALTLAASLSIPSLIACSAPLSKTRGAVPRLLYVRASQLNQKSSPLMLLFLQSSAPRDGEHYSE